MNTLHLYTDGSCLKNGQEGARAGWAAILSYGEKQLHLSGKIESEKPTNNVAELTAVVKGIEAIKPEAKCTVVVRCDSEYVVKSINEKRVHSWAKTGWMTSTKKPVANVELWKKLISVCRERKNCTFTFEDVAAHSGDAYNELCDKLAKKAASI